MTPKRTNICIARLNRCGTTKNCSWLYKLKNYISFGYFWSASLDNCKLYSFKSDFILIQLKAFKIAPLNYGYFYIIFDRVNMA